MRWRIPALFPLPCGVLCAVFVPAARAIDADFVPGLLSGAGYSQEKIEVQGSSGRIDLPVTFPTANLSSSLLGDSVVGATGNDATLYTLLNSPVSSANSVLLQTDSHSGAFLGSTQLNARLSDIAYTNGQLYGISSSSTSLQIDTIAANGTTQSIFSQAEPSSNFVWRLSGATNGDVLLAARGASSSNVSGVVINPTSLATSSITLPGTMSNFDDTIINSAANSVISITAGVQTAASFPGGVSQGALGSSNFHRTGFVSNAVSDEFTYTYSPSTPAVAQTQWDTSASPSIVGLTDGLTRTPQVVTLSGPVNIINSVSPDGTTLSNVSATNLVNQGIPIGFNPTPFTISTQPAAPGDLSNRSLGQATATLNLATAQRSFYEVSSGPSITADYTHGSTIDQSRTVQVISGTATQFAYDPISSNIVGNGDAFLEQAGWEGIQGTVPTFLNGFVNPDPADHSFGLIPQATFPAAIRQFLQLPTANGPMTLSFTYFLDLFPDTTPDDIQVFLNGTQIADVTASSGSVQTFQTVINNPAFENLTNAILLFQTTSNDPSGDGVGIGNISLTAVPEPASASLLIFAAAALCRRRP